MSKPDIEAFIEQPSLHHLTIEFTTLTLDTETAFLDNARFLVNTLKTLFSLSRVLLDL